MGSGRSALVTINSRCPHCGRENFNLHGKKMPGLVGEVGQLLRQLRRPKCRFCKEKLSVRIRFLQKVSEVRKRKYIM